MISSKGLSKPCKYLRIEKVISSSSLSSSKSTQTFDSSDGAATTRAEKWGSRSQRPKFNREEWERIVTLGFYTHQGMVYVPTFARTDAGFYMHIEPIEVVSTSDTKSFAEALKRSISRGNPVVCTPLRHEYKKPEVLKHAKVKSWSLFEKESSSWSVSETNGIWEFGK